MAGASYIKKNAPKARKRPPRKSAPLVRTMAVFPSTHRATIQAMGTVIPARQVLLKAGVSGPILFIHPQFREGGLLKKGEVVLQIDPEDYRLAVKEMESQVVTEEYELKLEMGRQEVAQREWALLNDGKPVKAIDEELALRKPHLEKAKADLAATGAQLKQARLNLSRTAVIAPFNSVVRKKNVDIGSHVSSQEELAELAGTDVYWIKVPVPVDRLKWMTIPGKESDAGSVVHIFYGNGLRSGYKRTGKVVKLLPDVEEEGRMARLLVSVKDPLGLNTPGSSKPPLLIGEYVKVKIEGHAMERVFRIPRTALRENEKIWIAGDDGLLQVRKVSIFWRDIHHVFLEKGLNAGERLIVSDLAVAVEGMAIRIGNTDPGGAPDRDMKKRRRKEG
jgi:RND family efflux transporter MFP subunit